MSTVGAVRTLAVLVLCLIVGLVAVILLQPFSPRSAQAGDPVSAAPVTVQPFDDARPVSVELELGGPTTLRSPASGTVTALACQPGATIASGSAPIRIDGRAILALHGETPWWRDLEPGVRGADVDALHAELTRLGHDVAADGDAFGSATSAALVVLLQDAGLPRGHAIAEGALTQSLWLPSSETAIASCDAGLGTRIESGGPFATAAAPVTGARTPAGVASLPRVLLVDDLELAIEADGTIAADALPLLAATPGVTAAAASGTTTLQATSRLATPVDAAAVPPGAIASDDGATGCVLGDGAPLDVIILGSQLGQTFVAFDEEAPASVDLRAPELAACS